MKPIPDIEAGVQSRLEAHGMELVKIEWGGTNKRPKIRVRVDFPDSTLGEGVTVNDCARMSRVLESWLDDHPSVAERYVLEVSSPGVERPLTRRRDFERFTGRQIEVRRTQVESSPSAGRLRGVLEGVEPEGKEYRVAIRTADQSKVLVPRSDIEEANLVFSWDEEG